MLREGFASRTGRRGALPPPRRVNGRLRARRGARLAAITYGGAIPDTADYDVVLEPGEIRVGTVNEDFAIESMAGDIFQLGNTSWRILQDRAGQVRVEDARGAPPTIPFWLGEAPARTEELSRAVSRPARRGRTALADDGAGDAGGIAASWLASIPGVGEPPRGRRSSTSPPSERALGVMPTQEALVLERFFDESGGMQLVLHAPFGSRLNRAWGLALRKRFCRKFNFELQAAATEDAIVLSLGATHSFPLEEVFPYLNPATVRDVLVQALLDAPVFGVRWRWNATRALAVLRFRGGRRVPPQLQRMNADDLLSVVFPDQLACPENLAGDREMPDHPLVEQTLTDCLEEAMDLPHLENLLRRMRAGELTLLARDVAGTVSARAGDAQRQAVRVPRRRAARGAAHASGAVAPLARSRDRLRSRRARRCRHRRGARRGVAAGAERRRAARSAGPRGLPHRRRDRDGDRSRSSARRRSSTS